MEITFRVNLHSASVDDLCLGYIDEEKGQWVCQGTLQVIEEDEDGSVMVVGTTDHFSSFAILLGENPEEDKEESDDDLLIRILIGCAIVAFIAIIVAMVAFELSRRRRNRNRRGRLRKLSHLSEIGTERRSTTSSEE